MKKFTILFLMLFAFNPAFAAEEKTEVKNDPRQTMKLLDLFGDVFERVRKEYVEEPSDKELVESAINGMLTHLDPHSSYLDTESFNEMQVQTRGAFGGLGIEVTMKNGMVYVVSPIDDTPAFKAGVQAGDYISHIDDVSVMGMTISEAVKKMRGKPGTNIKLTMIREGKDEPFDVNMERAIISIKSVRANAQGDIGYVRITTFSEQTSSDLEKAVNKLKEDIGAKKMKGLVLDLRNNPGGLLNQAIEVSDVFLDRGEIVSTRGREKESTKRYNATKGDMVSGLPMVVLINGGSASASEIVAGALKDQKRALIMGTKSFGKGSVQTVIPMPEDTAIRLTTALYYTPSGISIQAKGIEPDVLVEPAKIEFVKSVEKTTEAALDRHINNGDGVDIEKEKEPKKPEVKDEKKKEPVSEKEAEKLELAKGRDLYISDYQLARAVDFLKGIYVINRLDEKAEK